MSKYGPSRSEHKIRLGISFLGLVLLIVAYALNGITGIAALEIVVICGGFFGGSALWSARQLMKASDE